MMQYAVISQPGERSLNEDFAKASSIENKELELYALADGLGGHECGEVASELAVTAAINAFCEDAVNPAADPAALLSACFSRAQEAVLDRQQKERSQSEMKTTLTLLLRSAGQIQWGHVGDSRVYYFRNGRLIRRTLDHSVPQMLVLSGEIKENEIRFHEDRNRLLRVIGAPWDSPKYELSDAVKLENGMAFLLCSDGFWEWITEDQMVQLLQKAESPEQWLSDMEEIVLKNGSGKGMDNYSAIAVMNGRSRKKLFGLF